MCKELSLCNTRSPSQSGYELLTHRRTHALTPSKLLRKPLEQSFPIRRKSKRAACFSFKVTSSGKNVALLASYDVRIRRFRTIYVHIFIPFFSLPNVSARRAYRIFAKRGNEGGNNLLLFSRARFIWGSIEGWRIFISMWLVLPLCPSLDASNVPWVSFAAMDTVCSTSKFTKE